MWDPKQIGQKGGKARTTRKQAAARANGRKGGRPRKEPDDNAPASEKKKFRTYRLVRGVERYKGNVFPRLPYSEERVHTLLIRAGRRDLWKKLQQLKPKLLDTDKPTS